jgi:Zn-dependent membrane protease YugP
VFFFDPTYTLLIIAGLALGGLTQWFVNSSFRRYSEVPIATGLTGAEVARRMLDDAGLHDVRVEQIGGNLTDNYDPRSRVLRLSPQVFAGRSVASAGVASHEAGHAVQHARAFVFASLRSALVPAANIGTQLAWPLIFVGIFTRISGLYTLGILFFAAAVLFQVVTLPVEFDASRRAVASLRSNMMIPPEQVAGARRVLTAAALTYVAATLISVLQLLYFLSRRR